MNTHHLLLFVTFLSVGLPLVAQSPCSKGQEYSQMDFWLGDWKVETKNGQVAGYNKIEKILDGCVVLENWQGNGGSKGKSFNYYDPNTGKWHQKWVDNFGQPLEFEGVVVDDEIVFKGVTIDTRTGQETWQEMTLKKRSEDEVHQLWKQSNDQGISWTIVFEGYYRPYSPQE